MPTFGIAIEPDRDEPLGMSQLRHNRLARWRRFAVFRPRQKEISFPAVGSGAPVSVALCLTQAINVRLTTLVL